MSKLTAKFKEEVLEVIPPTFYFFAILHLVAGIRALMANGSGLPLSASVSITRERLRFGLCTDGTPSRWVEGRAVPFVIPKN